MSELAIFRTSFFDAPFFTFPSTDIFANGSSIFSLDIGETKTIFQSCCTRGGYTTRQGFAASGPCSPYCRFQVYIANFTITNVPGTDNLSSIAVLFFNQGTALRLNCVQTDLIVDDGFSTGVALATPFDRIDVTTISPFGRHIPTAEPKFGYYNLSFGVA